MRLILGFCENIVYILIDLFNAILTVPLNREGNKGMWNYSTAIYLHS